MGDFNTPLSSVDGLSRQKINMETQPKMTDQMDLIDIYRTFPPSAAEYTFFSSVKGTFSRIHHIWGHKSSLIKFKKTEIRASIFSDQNTMRLEITYRQKTVENTNTWRLNNMLLNNQWVTGESEEEFKEYLETNDNENMMTQNLWD